MAASADDSRSTGRLSVTECPVCLSTFKIPKILKCGHSICEECSKKLSTNFRIQCPVCRKWSESVGLVTNYALQDVIEANEKKEKDGKEKRSIEFPFKCIDCEERISLAKALVCLECKKIVCAGCGFKDHRGHFDKLENLDKTLDKSRQEFAIWRQKVEQSYLAFETSAEEAADLVHRRSDDVIQLISSLRPMIPRLLRSYKSGRTSLVVNISEKDLQDKAVTGDLQDYLQQCETKLTTLRMKYGGFKNEAVLIVDMLSKVETVLKRIFEYFSRELESGIGGIVASAEAKIHPGVCFHCGVDGHPTGACGRASAWKSWLLQRTSTKTEWP